MGGLLQHALSHHSTVFLFLTWARKKKRGPPWRIGVGGCGQAGGKKRRREDHKKNKEAGKIYIYIYLYLTFLLVHQREKLSVNLILEGERS